MPLAHDAEAQLAEEPDLRGAVTLVVRE